MMIWHIFRKDWKLLWPLVIGVAGVQVVNSAFWLIRWNWGGSQMLGQISGLCAAAMFLVMGVVIAIAVQQEPVPGDRQDWLVRPIRRRDLMLAKLLFIAIAIHGPLLLVDLALGLIMGFPFGTALASALSHGVSILLDLSLPVFAVAAMTPTLVVLFGGVMTIGLAGLLAVFLIGGWRQFHGGLGPLMGIWWIVPTLWAGLALLAVAVILPLQYFRRATRPARAVAIGAVCLAPILMLLPWTPAFSLQQMVSVDPDAAKAIGIAFDPSLGKLVMEPGSRNDARSIWLPLHVSGLRPQSMVINDRTYVRVIDDDGKTIYRGATMGQIQALSDIIDNFPVRTTVGGDVRTHQRVTLPGRIYDLVGNRPVRIELDYSLTLFRLEGADRIAAVDGDKPMTNIGRCKSGIDSDGDEIEVLCIGAGRIPSCGSAVLENPVSGKRNPPHDLCQPDYSPYIRPFMRFALYPFGVDVGFRDPQGLAKYPVDSAQLADAQVVLKSYAPVTHFTRHLVIPQVRLSDWGAQTPDAQAPDAQTPDAQTARGGQL